MFPLVSSTVIETGVGDDEVDEVEVEGDDDVDEVDASSSAFFVKVRRKPPVAAEYLGLAERAFLKKE
jgi:hypothetical protein